MIKFFNVTANISTIGNGFISTSSDLFSIAANSIDHAKSRLNNLVEDYDSVEIVQTSVRDKEFPLVLISRTGNIKGKVNHKHFHV